MSTSSTLVIDRARTEHLVDRILAFLLPGAVEVTRRTIIRTVHRARAARQAGDPRLALHTIADLQLASAPRDLACWAYGEWLAAARRLSLSPNAVLYRAATGQAAILEPDHAPGCLRVVAALGLSWEPGRVLSGRCLRGLVPLFTSQEGGAP